MQVRYDSDADAVYVKLRPGRSHRTREIDTLRIVDYDEDGEVVGVEFLQVSGGVNLDGVPHAEEVAEALRSVPQPAGR